MVISIVVHNDEGEKYSRDQKNAFKFGAMGWSYKRGSKPAKFAPGDWKVFSITGWSRQRDVHDNRGFTVLYYVKVDTIVNFWERSIQNTFNFTDSTDVLHYIDFWNFSHIQRIRLKIFATWRPCNINYTTAT